MDERRGERRGWTMTPYGTYFTILSYVAFPSVTERYRAFPSVTKRYRALPSVTERNLSVKRASIERDDRFRERDERDIDM